MVSPTGASNGQPGREALVRAPSRISAILLQVQSLTNFEVPEGKASCYGLQRGLRFVRVNKVSSERTFKWKAARLHSAAH